MGWRCFICAVMAAFGALGATDVPAPVDATTGILKAFATHPVVAIGEMHWLREAGDFYVSLVKTPGFAERVNDIVVEFSTPRYQATLDRYVNGEDVPGAELREVWRNTTKVFAWESPIYPRLLAAVRQVNASLPRARRIRVLGGDGPIDWTAVHDHDQWASFQPNDRYFAKTIMEQVLARKRRALVILGSNHLTKGGDRNHEPDTTTTVEASYPRSVFVVLLAGKGYGNAAAMKDWPVASLAPVGREWAQFVPFGKRTLADCADAVLWLGPSLTKAEPAWDELDARYLKELDRRSRIEWGCAFSLDRWKLGQRPCP